MRILVAEDDLTSRRMLVAVLQKGGYEVIETTNGAEALECLQKSDAPNLAILDWMMPVMDGLSVVRRIRETNLPLPPYLILLTTKGEKADVVAGLESGADDYLPKPFDAGELRARVEVGRRMLELQQRLATQIQDLHQALEHIRTLQGILPICMHCKKIRNDKGYWEQLEGYISKHSHAEFTHGLCEECLEKFYPNDKTRAKDRSSFKSDTESTPTR